jgi:SAM-dependent methyltransferase
MAGKTILDFGVGYGRIMRLLYYYSDPGRIWGVDAWAESLQTCRDAGMLGNLSQSDSVPTSLPVGDARFDVGVAFSVFTHLKPSVAESALDAVRASMADGGIFVATVRPIEFWEFLDTTQGREISVEMCHDHRTQGHAYFPHPGARGDTYGETSLALDFFDRPGWKVVSHDWSRVDYFQVSVVLQAV